MAEFVELQIEAGSTYDTTITVNDVNGAALNLTSYTARSQMRKSYQSTNYTEFDITIPNPADGTIGMALTAANTANIKAGRHVFDVEIEDGAGVITRIFEGIITVLPNVTK